MTEIWIYAALSGLGLAVVARIAEQLGGQLRVDSRVDGGTRVSFLVAFSTEQKEQEKPHTRSAQSQAEVSYVNCPTSTAVQNSPRPPILLTPQVGGEDNGIVRSPVVPVPHEQPSPQSVVLLPPMGPSASRGLRILIVEVCRADFHIPCTNSVA